jgi:hypothetical protein
VRAKYTLPLQLFRFSTRDPATREEYQALRVLSTRYPGRGLNEVKFLKNNQGRGVASLNREIRGRRDIGPRRSVTTLFVSEAEVFCPYSVSRGAPDFERG